MVSSWVEASFWGDFIVQSILVIVDYFCTYSTHFLEVLRVLVEEVAYLIVLITMG